MFLTFNIQKEIFENPFGRLIRFDLLVGEWSRQLLDDSLLKLKALYSLTEQLYAGSLFTIKAVMTEKGVPKFMKGVLEVISTIPKQIEELKRSVARKGAMAALSQSLAYAPALNPAEMMDGFSQLKDDGSQFTQEDYAHCMKASRILASRLAADADLSSYQAAYSEDNK